MKGYSGSVRRLTRISFVTAFICALMYVSALMPSGKMSAVAAAGILTVIPVVSYGRGWAAAVYAASSLLSALIVPDKWCVLMFAGFFGYYPIAKSLFERQANAAVRWAMKLTLAVLVFCVAWFALRAVIFPEAEQPINPVAALVAGLIGFTVYDIGLTKLISLYIARFAKIFDSNGGGAL